MFKLTSKFLERFENKQPAWGFGALSYFTYKRTYARLMEDGRQEEYYDTCRRVTEGVFRIQEKHCKLNRIPWLAHSAQKSAQEFFERMWDFKFTPPGRGFWIMGTDLVDRIGSAALQNCGFVSTKNIDVELADSFAWAMDMLMLGVGVGFDTKGAGKVTIGKPKEEAITFVIPDTREGWVESVRLLINSFQGGPRYIFDYSLIRPKGAPIKGFGGVASGPEPLRELHAAINSLLSNLIGKPISSVAIVDIMNLIGKCVVAGNVRRSAELAIGEIADTDYVTMKDYKRFAPELTNHRWASNNSVFAQPFSDFKEVAPNIALNGEPGLIFMDNCHHYGRFKDGFLPEDSDNFDNAEGFNPCAEQCLEHKELCCLVETYPSRHDNFDDFKRTLKFAYLYAKTVTLVPTHDETTNSVMMRNRRIGCSMSGVQQAIKKFGLHKFLTLYCDVGYNTVKTWDRIYSRWLGIPRSIRMTTVKPSGTVSLLAGVTPGVHCTHSEYYYRTIRLSGNSPFVKVLFDAGYRIEPSVNDRQKLESAIALAGYQASATLYEDFESYKQIDPWVLFKFCELGGTVIVYFPIQETNFTKSKFDITLWEQLTLVKEMQHYWSDNSVSCTVTIKPEEVKDLVPAIEYFSPYVKTLSFLPLENHHYEQAPYQAIDKAEFEAYSAQLKPLNLNMATDGNIKGSKFCTNDTCEV